jgi:hypothetical protein
MSDKTTSGRDIIATYVGADLAYQQGKLMFVAGKQDAAKGDVGTLTLPAKAQGVTIDSHNDTDVVAFSYVYTQGNQSSLRELMVKIAAPTTPARFSVLVPSADGNWVTRTADVTLVLPPDSQGVIDPAAFNPHGLVQNGNTLYLIDYETKSIVIVDAGALETAADNAALTVDTFDLSGDLPGNKRGQAIIALGDYLYALYIDSDASATKFDVSILFRLSIDSTTRDLAVDAQTSVGMNAQSIIPVNDGTAAQLLIPAIGGRQWYVGGTNGIKSNIYAVTAEGDWENDPSTVKLIVTGDVYPDPIPDPAPAPTAYDIHAVAGAMRDGSSFLYILTQIYTGGSGASSPNRAPWRLYRTTVSKFLSILATENTISGAVTAGKLTLVDEDTARATSSIPFGISFWDILYEQVPGNDSTADRLWFARGTPLLVTRTGKIGSKPSYGSPTALEQEHPYALFGFIGGTNINMGSLDLTIETLNQATRGVSLKRTLRKAQAPKPTEEEIAAANTQAKTGND